MNENTSDIIQQIDASFRQKGYQVTWQRRTIITFLYEKGTVSDMEEVWIDLRARWRISWATVYNTVKLLVQLGWLKVVEQDHRNRKYVLDTFSVLNN